MNVEEQLHFDGREMLMVHDVFRREFALMSALVRCVAVGDHNRAQIVTDHIERMSALVPPGVTVPLHSHDDAEDFFILSGAQQVLTKSDQGLQWRDVNAGDYVHIPGATPHAHRNVSDEPAVELVITTARLGRFFREIARPGARRPPTPGELAEFVAVAAKYGYALGTAEQNAAVGIALGA